MRIGVERMIDHILRMEGGYVNHPADRGGSTKFGVTQKTLSEWRGHWVTEQDVKGLQESEARDIYYHKYFERPKLHLLPEQVQQFVFDCSINHGPSRAVKFIQKVCTEAGIAYLKVDGINGPNTRGAAEKAQGEMGDYFQNALVEERIRFFKAIVKNDSSQKAFLEGWLNRANSFRVLYPEC